MIPPVRFALLSFLLVPALASAAATDLLSRPDSWFRSDAGRRAMDCVLSWQAPEGGWPKNKDTTAKPFDGKRGKLEGTFDNKATTGELRLLARAVEATGDVRCREAFLKGFDHVLYAQYANGGWPQFHPPGKKYHRHITFNDGTMVRLLELLRDARGYEFIDAARQKKAADAFERGVACILKCQITVDGKPAVWCAQHDEVTFAPTMARDYELPSLSGSESAGILRFLMTLEKPSPEVVRAVKGGVAWFESAKIPGYRYDKSGKQRVLEKAAGVPPLWARFYDLETGKPFFCDRDGIKKDTVDEIGAERRNGYAWYGNWGESVAKDFAKWPHR